MAGLPGESYALAVVEFVKLWSAKLGLNNSPEMKDRDLAKKDQAQDDKINQVIQNEDEKKTRDLLG